MRTPDIIDLITLDSNRGEVVLLIVEKRPWGSDPKQLEQFDEKLNRYFAYVLDGFLAKDYPQYDRLPLRIQIDSVDEPTDDRTRRFLEGVGMVCEQNDINFIVRVVQDQR